MRLESLQGCIKHRCATCIWQLTMPSTPSIPPAAGTHLPRRPLVAGGDDAVHCGVGGRHALLVEEVEALLEVQGLRGAMQGRLQRAGSVPAQQCWYSQLVCCPPVR